MDENHRDETLDAMLDHLRLQAEIRETNLLRGVVAHLRAGKKIAAIKQYRETTGTGLKEAKEAVEAIEAELRAEFPDQMKAAGKSGCLGLLLMAVAAAVAWAWWR